jgi:hypothetical protein
MAALALLASCGGSDPVIVSGTIATNGDSVDLEIFPLRGGGDLSHPIASTRELEGGPFELRGVMDASDPRRLFLSVTPQGWSPFSCGTGIVLPPLRRSQDRWVDARTGEPVALHIALHRLVEARIPGTTYTDWCPLETHSGLSTVSVETAEGWADKWCQVKLGMNLVQAQEIMGKPTLTFHGQHLWDAYQWHFTALAKSDWTIRQLDSTEEGSTPETSKVQCGDPVPGVPDEKTRQ